jgi:hypothetical protein
VYELFLLQAIFLPHYEKGSGRGPSLVIENVKVAGTDCSTVIFSAGYSVLFRKLCLFHFMTFTKINLV